MLRRATLQDIRNAISSLVSAYGLMRSGAQVGRTTAKSGLDRAPVNLSARQAKVAGLLTSGTYGLRSTISFASADLQSSLASRLQAKTALLGSTLYRLTWKERTTPSGLSIPALRASAHRTSDRGFIGWATPNVMDSLPMRSEESLARAKTIGGCSNVKDQMLLMVSGARAGLNTRPTGTETADRCNPVLPRWLMGLPPSWDDCAATATPSSRRKRKPSSKPISKREVPDDARHLI